MQTNKALKGVIWSALERFSFQGVQFAVSIILARLLTPNDFGLVAIVLVFSTIFQTINESGLNTALVYKLDRDDIDYSTAFYANIAIGVASYLLLYFAAPFIADFYRNSSLISVMRILSLNLIINSFGLVQVAKYTINVDFKTQAKATLIAAVISGAIGISVAYITHSVYSIVAQQLSNSFVYVSLMWIFAKWVPLFTFSIQRFKLLFLYAYKLIIARVISVVFDDIYSLAIGKLYNPSALGFYNRAMSFRQILSKNIIGIVQRVSIPLLCQDQDNHDRMRKTLLRFMDTTALFVYPLLAGLMILSKPLVHVLLGEAWLRTADMLILGCPAGFFYLISTFNRNVFNATGRTDLALKTEIVKKMIFVCIFLLTMRYKLEVLLIGLIIISIIEMIIDVFMTKKQIGLRFRDELLSLLPILGACLIMCLFIAPVILFFHSSISQLIVGFAIGVLSYSTICYIFNVSDFRILLHGIINKTSK